MTFDRWLVGCVTVVYFGVALVAAVNKDWPRAIIFFGYSVANVGFLL